MHTFYKEHEGSYAVAVPCDGGGWHVLFRNLSLKDATQTVHYLNGGTSHWELPVWITECAA